MINTFLSLLPNSLLNAFRTVECDKSKKLLKIFQSLSDKSKVSMFLILTHTKLHTDHTAVRLAQLDERRSTER